MSDQTRRGFLGLLGAIPIAGPVFLAAMSKAAAQPAPVWRKVPADYEGRKLQGCSGWVTSEREADEIREPRRLTVQDLRDLEKYLRPQERVSPTYRMVVSRQSADALRRDGNTR